MDWIGLGSVEIFQFLVGLGWVGSVSRWVWSDQVKRSGRVDNSAKSAPQTCRDSVISAGITVIITYRETHFMVIEITQHIEYITQCSWYISKPHFHDMPAMRPDNKALIASAVVIQHRGNFR